MQFFEGIRHIQSSQGCNDQPLAMCCQTRWQFQKESPFFGKGAAFECRVWCVSLSWLSSNAYKVLMALHWSLQLTCWETADRRVEGEVADPLKTLGRTSSLEQGSLFLSAACSLWLLSRPSITWRTSNNCVMLANHPLHLCKPFRTELKKINERTVWGVVLHRFSNKVREAILHLRTHDKVDILVPFKGRTFSQPAYIVSGFPRRRYPPGDSKKDWNSAWWWPWVPCMCRLQSLPAQVQEVVDSKSGNDSGCMFQSCLRLYLYEPLSGATKIEVSGQVEGVYWNLDAQTLLPRTQNVNLSETRGGSLTQIAP